MMRNTLTVLKKELRSYFDSPAAYIFIIIFLLLSGSYFVSTFFLENAATLRNFFETAPILLLFLAPVISMRLLADEKRLGTFEILQATTLGMGELVVGKFCAAWILLLFALLPTSVYAATAAFLGNVDSGTLLGGYLGLTLMGGLFIAVGLVGSSLSNNQIVSLIIGFTIALILFVLDKVLLYVPAVLVPVIEYLSVGQHFSSMARGVLDSRDVVYYVSMIVLMTLLATVFAAREPKEALWRIKTSRVARQFPKLVLVAIFLLFLNLLSIGFFVRVDLTDSRMYTLSEQTKQYLRSLDDNFLVTGYFSSELPPPYHNHRRAVQELLEEYRAYAGARFNYQFVNPLSDLSLEQTVLQSGITPIQVKVVKNDKIQMEKAYIGLGFSYADRNAHLPVVTSLERLEYEITSAIKRLTTGRKYTIAFLSGHGGPELSAMQSLLQALSRQHVIETVQLSARKPIPAGVTAVVVVAPRRRFSDDEKLQIDQYLMGGGRMAFFLDRMIIDSTSQYAVQLDLGLDEMFDTYGWIINTDLVADARCAVVSMTDSAGPVPIQKQFSFPFYPIAIDFNQDNDVVKTLGPVGFAYVSSVDPRLASIRGLRADVLITSSTASRSFSGERIDLQAAQNLSSKTYSEKHIPLAVAFEGTLKSAFTKRYEAPSSTGILPKSPQTKIVVVGDGDFLLDSHAKGYHNVAFAANVIDWLVDDAGLTGIRARDLTPKPLMEVSESTKATIKFFNVVGPSALVVAGGLVRLVFRIRRRNRLKRYTERPL